MNCETEPCFPELVPRVRESLAKALAAGNLEGMSDVIADYLVTGIAPRRVCGFLSRQKPPRFATDVLYFLLGFYESGGWSDDEARGECTKYLEKLESATPMNTEADLDTRLRRAITRAIESGHLDRATLDRAAGYLVSGRVEALAESPSYHLTREPPVDILYSTAWTLHWLSRNRIDGARDNLAYLECTLGSNE